MRFSTITPRQAVAALGVCFAFLLVAGPASARPDGYQPQLKSDSSDAFTRYVANHRAHEDRVAKAALGDGDQSDPVSSYLANLRADKQAYNASSTGIPDSVADLVAKNAAPPTVAADGFDWETTGVVTAGIAAAMLLALMSTIALRDRRGLKSA